MSLSPAIPDAWIATKCDLASDLLRSGTLRLRASGRSMLPTVWPGDTLVVEPTGGDVAEGDIVLFNSGRRLVAHRVVARKGPAGESHIQTQGDAEPLPDAPVSRRDLMGRVSLIIRNGRCIEPGRGMRFSERAVAALLRRSQITGRVVVGARGLRRAAQNQN